MIRPMHTLHRAASAVAVAVVIALAAACSLGVAACGDTTYVFDDVDVGQVDGDGSGDRAPRAKSNSQFLRALYADLLGRTPESYDFIVTFNGVEAFRLPIDEQRLLVGVLDGVGDPTPLRALVAAGVVGSDEAAIPDKSEIDDPAAFITDTFRTLLGRDPGAYELKAFVDEWASDPAVNPKTVIRALVGSREYQSF